MDDQLLISYAKQLTLNYLEKIKADVDDADGLLTVTIPAEHERFFGGKIKRITFDPEIASLHSCELAHPGSNFLSVILTQVQRQAPVIAGHLTKKATSPSNFLDNIRVHNCKVKLVDHKDNTRIAVRMYFNVSVKSIKSVAMLRWIDVDLDSLQILNLPHNIEIEEDQSNISYNKGDQRIDVCYSKAVETLEREIEPLATKYYELTRDDLERDIELIKQSYLKHVQEINKDVEFQKSKLREYDRKIMNARYISTQQKYMQQKSDHEKRIQKAEQKAIKQLEKLTRDRDSQIIIYEKRYRPIINVALIASQIFSYSSSQCKLDFTNQLSHKEINADFLDPVGTFTLHCDVCNTLIDESHLCVNSHLICTNCSKECVKCGKGICVNCSSLLNPCYICQEGLCSDCNSTCQFCEDLVCEEHSLVCKHCTKNACYFCSDKCQICSQRFCNNVFEKCKTCNKIICHNDREQCFICMNYFCPDDKLTCAICENIHCNVDAATCDFCGQQYSSNCVEKNTCQTCTSLLEVEINHPAVNELRHVEPDLKKFKKWYYSSNSKISVFKAKKTFGSRIVIYDKKNRRVLESRKGGLF